MFSKTAIAILAVVLAMLTIQTGASFAKQLFPLIGAEGTTALRVGFAALVLLMVTRPWRQWTNFNEFKPVLAYGACLGLMNLLFYWAIARIPLGIAVALEFTGPLAVALLSSKRKRDLIWVTLAIFGIVLLVPELGGQHGIGQQPGLDPLGVALALAAGACWAGYILFGQKTKSAFSGTATVALGMTVAACIAVPVGAISVGTELLAPQMLFYGFLVAMLSSAIPYSLEMVALRHLQQQHFSVLMSLEPAIAALAGLLLLGEALSILQWLAVAMVVSASLGSSLQHRQSEPIVQS